MGIRPLQLDVTEGVSNNSTVPTLGKVEDLIGVENLWDRITGSPNYVKPHTDGDSVYAYYDAGGWFSIDPTATRIDLKVGSDITELHINSDTVDTDVNIWGTGSGSPVFFLDADANAIAINTTILSGFDVTVSGGVYFGGDIGATANRISKGWFTNLEITNYPSVNGTPLSNQYLATTDMPSFAQLTVDNIKLNGNTILVTNADGSLTIDCNGAGTVSMPRAGTFGAVTAATQIYVGNIDIIGDVITSSANVDLKSSLSTGNVRILDDSDVPVFCYCNSTDIFAFSDTVTISVGNALKVNTINTYNAITGVTIEGVQLLNDNLKADKIQGLTSATSIDIDKLTINTTSTGFTTISSSDTTNVLTLAGSTSSAILRLDRGATNQNGDIEFQTASVTKWTAGLIANEADDFLIKSSGIAGDIELLAGSSTGNVTLTAGSNGDVTLIPGINGEVKIENVRIDGSKIYTSAGALTLNSVANMVIIGDGSAGVDMVLFFNGQSNDGQIKWWEDEAYFDFDHYIAQPGVFAEIYVADASTAQSIATGVTYTKSTAFTSNGQSANCTADATNDKITITKTGKYRVSGSCSGTSGKANLTWRGAAFLNGAEQDQVHWKRKMTTTTDSGAMSFTGFVDVTSAPWDLDFRLRHDDGGNQNFTIEYANLNVEYIGAT